MKQCHLQQHGLDINILSEVSRTEKDHAISLICLVSCVRLFAALWTVAHEAPLSLRIVQARILEWVAMPSSKDIAYMWNIKYDTDELVYETKTDSQI